MNMNSNCNVCYQSPCQCHTTCTPPVVCIPTPPSNKPKPPTVSVQGLIDLINEKCDKETCAVLQVEIWMLYEMLGLQKPDKPTKPGTPTPPIVKPPVNKPLPGVAFQLIKNMVDSLKGDLTDKYPSAELMKTQIKAIWDCLKDKQVHHGLWKDNIVIRSMVDEDNMCLLDGEDHLPKTTTFIIPVDVGSTVFHIIEGRKCLFESLVDNNIVEPSKASVLEGKWMNYCDIKDAIDCVLPRRLLKDCKQACDDPNKDGVIEDKTMCERMLAVEAYMKAHP